MQWVSTRILDKMENLYERVGVGAGESFQNRRTNPDKKCNKCQELPVVISYGQKWGFLGSSDGKEFGCNAGDPGLIPGLRRSPGEENGNPLQYSCLENSMGRGTSWAIVHGGQKELIPLNPNAIFLRRPSLDPNARSAFLSEAPGRK